MAGARPRLSGAWGGTVYGRRAAASAAKPRGALTEGGRRLCSAGPGCHNVASANGAATGLSLPETPRTAPMAKVTTHRYAVRASRENHATTEEPDTTEQPEHHGTAGHNGPHRPPTHHRPPQATDPLTVQPKTCLYNPCLALTRHRFCQQLPCYALPALASPCYSQAGVNGRGSGSVHKARGRNAYCPSHLRHFWRLPRWLV